MSTRRKKRTDRQQKLGQEVVRKEAARKLRRGRLEAPALRNRLPAGVRPVLDNKTPVNIVTDSSPSRTRGMDTVTWQDEGGLTMFVHNLAADGAVQVDAEAGILLTLSSRVIGQVEDEAPDPMPGTFIVQTDGSADARLAAKELVSNLMAEASDEGRIYAALEPTAVRLNDAGVVDPQGNKVALTFVVKSRDVPQPVLKVSEFEVKMGGAPLADVTIGVGPFKTTKTKSGKYKDISAALADFHTKLAATDARTFQLETVDDNSSAPLKERKKVVDDAYNDLLRALDSYLADSRTNILKKSKRESKQDKKEVVQALKDQLEAARQDGFKRELDDLRQTRWAALNPLDRSQIIPGTSRVLGSGAQGDVVAHRIQTANGEFFAAVKLDDNGLNSDATGAGIPEENPQQSVRAVAAYTLNNTLEMNTIPRTEFIVSADENGRPQLGQALAVVSGVPGQKKHRLGGLLDAAAVENAGLERYRSIQANPDDYHELEYEEARITMLSHDYDEATGNWYRAQVRPVDVDYTSGVVQKGLADLQLLDVIIGHADRNPGNFIFERDAGQNVVGVKGIDNDDSFGQKWRSQISNEFGDKSKTPGVPPIIDFGTALNVLKLDDGTLESLMEGLDDDEIEAAKTRLQAVQETVKARVLANDIASGDEPLYIEDLAELGARAGLPNDTIIDVKTWGPELANAHVRDNSYLGQAVHNKQDIGVAAI